VFCSSEYLAILGYAEDGLASTENAWTELVLPEDLARAEADLAAFLAGTVAHYSNEHRLRCRDGRYKWVYECGKIVERSPDGKPRRVIGNLSDIDRRKRAELALRDSEQLFREIFDHAPIGLALISLDLRYLDVNHSLCRMLGYDEQELLQLRTVDLIPAEAIDEDRRLLAEGLAGERTHVSREKRYLHRLGGIVHLQVDTSLVRDPAGQSQYLISQYQDISERLRYQDALFEEKELAQVTLGGVTDAVVRCDAHGRIRYTNDAAHRLLGRGADQLERRTLNQVVTLLDDRGRALADPLAIDDPAIEGPRVVKLRTGTHAARPIEYSVTRLNGRDGEALGTILVMHDVTHLRMLSEQLLHQASHDPLTGLPNRREFEAELAHVMETARSTGAAHSVLYIDLDQFKLVNDTCGHPAGDRLLCELTSEMRGAVPAGAMLARLGGDEFAVILPVLAPGEAVQAAERIADKVRQFRFVHGGRAFQIGSSIGVCALDAESSSPHDVMSRADTACYIAKRLGRDRVQLYRESDETVRQVHTDMDWASRIEEALASERIELHAQHIVSLDGGRHACEILMRIRDSHGQCTRPAAFLAAAERFGFSTRIDRWVVRRALGALQVHFGRYGDLPFEYAAINLSGSSISDEEFARYLLQLLQDCPLPSSRLAFEITETAAFSNVEHARRLIDTLRERGYRILLDDFGSGFTSFERLRGVAADGIKIDMAYTRELASDPFNRTVVEFICRIGAQLGLEVIAEGVETESTLAMLRRLGAQRAQGHLFHHAQPLTELLAAHGNYSPGCTSIAPMSQTATPLPSPSAGRLWAR
ncbi:MAG: EAL domain-containing protein, partial [Sinimarinibacterium sp.]